MSGTETVNRRADDWTAAAALTLAALFWSGNFIAGRALRVDIDPITLNTLRWTLASLTFLPFVASALRAHVGALRRHWRYLLALGATGIAAFHMAVYIALTQTTATNALLVLALAPVVILIGAALTGAGRPSGQQWAGSTVSVIGVAILVTSADPAVLRSLSFNAGDLWMLGAVALWAVYSLLLKWRPRALPPTVTLAASMFVGAVLMLAVLLLSPGGIRFAVTTASLLPLVYIVAFPSLLAFRLWAFGVARMGPARAGQFVNLMPVFGPVLAMAILGERIAPVQMGGALVVLTGMAAVVLGGKR